MSANIKQPAINLRQLANDYECHHHNNDYVQLDKLPPQRNLLINGDFTVSQRADYSSPITVGNEYTLDRWEVSASGDTTKTIQQIDTENGKGIRTEVTAELGSSTYLFIGQRLEKGICAALNNKTATLTARVRTNSSIAQLRFTHNRHLSSIHESVLITGDGNWQIVSLTVDNISSNYTDDSVFVNARMEGKPNVGDYIEISDMQLELGDRFTGFEAVHPADQLAKCQRYYQKFTIRSYAAVGTFRGSGGGTLMNGEHKHLPVELRILPTVGYSGAATLGFYLLSDGSYWGSGTPNFNFQYPNTYRISCSVTGAGTVKYVGEIGAEDLTVSLDAEIY